MPTHDIIDNRNERLVDHIRQILPASDRAKFDDQAEDELMDLNEAEEFLRNLAKDDPNEFERIQQLRDGIRSAKASSAGSFYVFCQVSGRHRNTSCITCASCLPKLMTKI